MRKDGTDKTSRVRLTLEQAREMIGIGRTALWKIRRDDKTFPRPYRPTGKREFFWSDEIEAWMASRQEAA